jgi:hypothetical protein
LIWIIFGRFYQSIEVPEKKKIIIDIWINWLEENKKKNFNEKSINEQIKKVVKKINYYLFEWKE